jgi:GTP-dependent phosphoenolpyruvate carboxykinase
MMAIEVTAPSANESLLEWVSEVIWLCEPSDVHWCDGSVEEHDALCRSLVGPIRDFYAGLGDSRPTELQRQLEALERRLREARSE